MTGVRPSGSDPSAPRHRFGRRSVYRTNTGSDPQGLTPLVALLLVVSITPARAEPLKLEPGKALELLCETRGVVVATDAANATSGQTRLRIEPEAGSAARGTWTIVASEETHKAGIGVTLKETCAKGCPFDVSAKGEAQLWAPGVKALNNLADGEALSIAVIRPEDQSLRASTFRGKDIEALEEGTCRVASP